MLTYLQPFTIVSSWFDGEFIIDKNCYIVCRCFYILPQVLMNQLYQTLKTGLYAPVYTCYFIVLLMIYN